MSAVIDRIDIARQSSTGALPHESLTFGLAEARATMQHASGMFEQLAALFEEIGEDKGCIPHIQHLAKLGRYYAHEHAFGLQAGLEVNGNHLDDCAGHLEEASEYCHHLEYLFLVVQERSAERNVVKSLAEVGRYSASDFANTLDVARERAMKAAGAEA